MPADNNKFLTDVVKIEEGKDYGFERQAEKWEYTDGAIFLVREISLLPDGSLLKKELSKYLS